MHHKILSVKAQDNYALICLFDDGSAFQYDMGNMIKSKSQFSELKSKPFFEMAQVDVGGYGVSWSDGIDISSDELYENGIEIKNPFLNLLSLGDATMQWGLSESTLRKSIAYGRFVDGIDIKKFGKQWVITKQAMIKEYGLPKRN